jgi:hypothetical protein
MTRVRFLSCNMARNWWYLRVNLEQESTNKLRRDKGWVGEHALPLHCVVACSSCSGSISGAAARPPHVQAKDGVVDSRLTKEGGGLRRRRRSGGGGEACLQRRIGGDCARADQVQDVAAVVLAEKGVA